MMVEWTADTMAEKSVDWKVGKMAGRTADSTVVLMVGQWVDERVVRWAVLLADLLAAYLVYS